MGNAPCFRKSRFWVARLVVLLAALWTAAQSSGQQAKPDVDVPDSWVVPIPFDPRAQLAAAATPEEARWILKDHQINAQNNEIFTHEVRQILTPAALNNASTISIDYDPGYQLLTFHWVRIWRGTNSLDRLDSDRIEVNQRGPDAEELLFNAEKTAVLPLEDVRPGDVIDYAYSVQGENPVFAGWFSGAIQMQSSQSIQRLATRLLWPAARWLYVENHGTDVKYSAVRKGDLIEFAWNARNIPGWPEEPFLPTGYEPYPWVQLSEFQKWADVNKFAQGLFTNTAALSPELKEKISELKRLPDRESQAAAALRFVQDEVRYVGAAAGASDYRAAPASTVFDRRYGDCKDKCLLLVTMLRALGVEAWPALVSTKMRQTLGGLHPSATVFNHAITQVNLDGGSYWLDGTDSYQRGLLAVRSWPLYGYALVVRPGTTGLTAIAPSPALPRTTVSQYMRLGSLDGQSDLKVITVAEGRDAEEMRKRFATTAHDEIERASLDYYTTLYPDIAQASPLVYTDDEQQNRIEVDEFYSIQKIWSRQPEDFVYHCRMFAANVAAAMKPAAISARTMPLGVMYPEHQIFRAEVVVPLTLIVPDERTIESPAFYFHRLVTIADGKLSLEYEYRTLAGEVLPEAAPDYVQQLDSAAQLMSYTISSN